MSPAIKQIARYRGVTPGDAAAIVRAISNTDNQNVEAMAWSVLVLNPIDRARFIERMSSILAAVADKMAEGS